jgi:hypothetical protein
MTPTPQPDGSVRPLAREIDALEKAEDGRTIAKMRDAEPHWDVPIEGAERHGDWETAWE